MKIHNVLASTVLLMVIFLTACGGTATQEAMMEDKEGMPEKAMTEEPMMEDNHGDTMVEPTHDTMMDDSMSTPDAMMDDSTGTMESPTWFGASLTDARTGQVFSINDFQGKVVLVETMAIWCTNCLQQQGQVKALHAQLGARDDFAFPLRRAEDTRLALCSTVQGCFPGDRISIWRSVPEPTVHSDCSNRPSR